MLDDYVIICTGRCLMFFELPPKDLRTSTCCIDLRIKKLHRWPFRIDSIVFRPRNPTDDPKLTPCHAPVPPIDIFARFDTFYPWPVNLLHHFIIIPKLGPRGMGSSGEDDLPFMLPPMMEMMYTSPLRHFTPNDLVIGRNGTAVWLEAMSDPHTQSVPADFGQRVMGKILSDVDLPPQNPDGPSGYASIDEFNSRNRHLTREPYITRTPIMTFHTQPQDDTWNKIAVDDEQGLIAIFPYGFGDMEPAYSDEDLQASE